MMNWFFSLLLTVHILVALVIIGLVLMQHGKGADMGAAFGSGASGSLLGRQVRPIFEPHDWWFGCGFFHNQLVFGLCCF